MSNQYGEIAKRVTVDSEIVKSPDDYDAKLEAKLQQNNVDRDTTNLEMLKFVRTEAASISERIMKSEESKTRWRRVIMFCLIIITIVSFGILIIVINKEISSEVNFSSALVLGVVANVLVSTLALLGAFIKFVTDVKYIEAFKEISKSLLDYLSSSNNGNR